MLEETVALTVVVALRKEETVLDAVTLMDAERLPSTDCETVEEWLMLVLTEEDALLLRPEAVELLAWEARLFTVKLEEGLAVKDAERLELEMREMAPRLLTEGEGVNDEDSVLAGDLGASEPVLWGVT